MCVFVVFCFVVLVVCLLLLFGLLFTVVSVSQAEL